MNFCVVLLQLRNEIIRRNVKTGYLNQCEKSRFCSVYILKYICSIYDSVRIVSLPSKFNKIALFLLISESIVLPL